MASCAYKPGEYIRRPVVAKSSEQSSEQSEDNSVDILWRPRWSWTMPVVNESKREIRSTRKDVEEDLPREKSKSQGKRKSSFASESVTKRLKKWSWTSEAVEILLKYFKEFKTKREFNGADFEVDLSTIYTEIPDAWRWIFLKILVLKLFKNREKIKYFACPPFCLLCT